MPTSLVVPRDAAAGKFGARWLDRSRWLGLGLAAAALGVVAYRVQVQNTHADTPAAAQVAVGWAFVVAGSVAWLRRPANRVGPLLLAAGFAYLTRQLRYSESAFLFTVFFLIGDLAFALVGHAILAYPSGRVSGRGARWLVRVGYATVVAFPFAVLLLHGQRGALLEMGLPRPRRSLLLLSDRQHAVELVQKTEIVVLFGLLASLLIAVITRRFWRASRRSRRVLAPLVLAAIALVLRAIYECVLTFVNQQPLAHPYLFWWQVGAFMALPLALLVGLLRARLARANVSGLVLELDRTPATPGSVQQALRHALADPSLALFFWLPERRGFVDAGGSPVSLPAESAERAVTRLEHGGKPIAALAYDASLREEPELVDAAAAAARLGLENARLHAETRAQLQQVRESRRRIVSAADAERRRIERNLHDGAQQRLLALALQLSSAQGRIGGGSNPDVEQLLAASVEELQGTIDELRTLARGLHPTVLVEFGLGAALEALVSKSPIPITVDVAEGRLPAEVESTAYFVACEALNNIVKHANATSGTIVVQRRDGKLLLEISDNGTGGAHAGEGSGLLGIRDRVEALGGRLRLHSPAGGGTRITVEIPCEP